MFGFLKNLFDQSITMLDTTKLQCAVYGDDEEHEAILCDNGELSTSIEIFGNSKPLTNIQFQKNMQYMADKLSSFFKSDDQRIIATYYNNPDDRDYVNSACSYYDECCDSLELNIKDVHRADLKKLANVTKTDRFILTIETGKNAILQPEYSRGEQYKISKLNDFFKMIGFKDKYNNINHKLKQYGQNPAHFNGSIFYTHQNTVNSVIDLINGIKSRYKVLHAKETMRFMHKIFDCMSPVNWTPITTPQTDEEIEADYMRFMRIADSAPHADKKSDLSSLLLPPLVTQIVGDDAEIHEDGLLSLNGHYFKAMYVDVPQKKIEPFSAFIQTTSDLPFVMSWHLEASLKKIDGAISRGNLIGMAGVLNSQSCKDIKRSSDILKAYRKDGVKPMAMYRLSFLTWAFDKDVCRNQANRLREKISKWGSEQVIRYEKANPLQSMLEVVPSIASPSINRAIPCLVEEALIQMPFDRVSSPWFAGGTNNFILATDHTIYPVYIGKKQKDFPRSIFIGDTGSGKTFTKNSLLLNTLFKKPYHKLPILAMCTIGYDGKLFASTIRSSLPKEKQHYVIADKPKLTADYAVNIFDTDYGARLAKAEQIDSIVGFLEQCFAEPDQVRLAQDFSSIVKDVVTSSYLYFSDDGDYAKEYTIGADIELDQELEQANINALERRKWTWWDVFDFFHDQGKTRLAYRCQLQAMPTLSDMVHVMSEYQSIFDDARSAKLGGEPIFERFKRRIIDLQRSYKNLCGVTRYNIESARMVILDLESVCPKGSKPEQPETRNDRQSALMYQLYFMFMTKKFAIYQNKDDFLSDTKVPTKYHKYHFNMIESEKGIPKIFDIDEFHRASKAYSFKTELDRIIREMRKYGAEFSGASQQVFDWNTSLLDNMGAIFIMNMDTEAGEQKEYYRKLLGFSDKDFALAESHLKGFNSKLGQPFLLLIKNIDGEQGRSLVPLYHISGINKLWALTTNKNDHNFRSELEEKLFESEVPNHILMAREVLCEIFPKGSIESKVESQLAIHPNKTIPTIKTELINKCLKIILEEKLHA